MKKLHQLSLLLFFLAFNSYSFSQVYSENSETIGLHKGHPDDGWENTPRGTAVVQIPFTAQNVVVRAYMANSPWPNNCDLGRGNVWVLSPQGTDSPIGWCKAGNWSKTYVGNSKRISVPFYNWSDCNYRWAYIHVEYTLQ